MTRMPLRRFPRSSGDAGAASTHPTGAAPRRRRAGCGVRRRPDAWAGWRGSGYDHAAIGREVDNDRWTRLGTHTVALHTGAVGAAALRWRAVWEVAEDVALVDGVSALQAVGLTGYTEDVVHVSVPRGAQCPQVDGVRIHRVTRRADEAAGTGLPRTRVEVAALRGAAWARSDRQAALILCMVVQQRLTTGKRLLAALPLVRNRGRRPFVRQVLRGRRRRCPVPR